jgi:hypothetical protein
MGKVARQSPQLSRSIRNPIAGLALVGVLFSLGATGINGKSRVSLQGQSEQPATRQTQEFYISVTTDDRDHPCLRTVIVAGSNRFMFDSGVVGSMPSDGAAPPAVTALFLTHLATTMTDGIDRALNDVPTAPSLRIWGPQGTRDWMRQTMGDLALEGPRRAFTVIDVREGVVSEAGDVTITAIQTAPSSFAYRVRFAGRSLLVASDLTYSEHLVARSADVDIAVIRHSDVAETVKLLQRTKPRLAVLSPDGVPATVAQIRQHYAGPLQLLGPGAHRIHVLERLALDDDIKWPQR